jgi:hypothetical protein
MLTNLVIVDLIIQKCTPAKCSPTNMIQLHSTPTSLDPCPLMIPTLPTRIIRLHPRILNRHAPPNPPLNHRTPIQPTHLTASHAQSPCIRTLAAGLFLADFVAVRVHQTQMLACSAHRHVLAQEEHPCAVDCPVAQVAVAREVEGAWCERVREVVADVCWVELVSASMSGCVQAIPLLRLHLETLG